MVFKERFQAARLLSVTSTWGKFDCQPGTRYGILGLTLTHYRQLLLYADTFYKQFGPRFDPTNCLTL